MSSLTLSFLLFAVTVAAGDSGGKADSSSASDHFEARCVDDRFECSGGSKRSSGKLIARGNVKGDTEPGGARSVTIFQAAAYFMMDHLNRYPGYSASPDLLYSTALSHAKDVLGYDSISLGEELWIKYVLAIQADETKAFYRTLVADGLEPPKNPLPGVLINAGYAPPEDGTPILDLTPIIPD